MNLVEQSQDSMFPISINLRSPCEILTRIMLPMMVVPMLIGALLAVIARVGKKVQISQHVRRVAQAVCLDWCAVVYASLVTWVASQCFSELDFKNAWRSTNGEGVFSSAHEPILFFSTCVVFGVYTPLYLACVDKWWGQEKRLPAIYLARQWLYLLTSCLVLLYVFHPLFFENRSAILSERGAFFDNGWLGSFWGFGFALTTGLWGRQLAQTWIESQRNFQCKVASIFDQPLHPIEKNPSKQHLIAIEGNIAAGKSTLCKKLSDGNVQDSQGNQSSSRSDVQNSQGNQSSSRSDVQNSQGNQSSSRSDVHIEYETIPPSMLVLFQSNIRAYAFAFQLHVMESRIHAWLRNSLRPPASTAKYVVFDRSCIGDVVFAIKHRLDKNFSVSAWKTYLNMVRPTVQLMRQNLSGILYLHADTRHCLRALKRRDNDDRDLPLEYLQSIDDVYFYSMVAWLRITDTPIRVQGLIDYNNTNISPDTMLAMPKVTKPRIILCKTREELRKCSTPYHCVLVWDDVEWIHPNDIIVDESGHNHYKPGWVHTQDFRDEFMNAIGQGKQIVILRMNNSSRNGLWEKVLKVWTALLDPVDGVAVSEKSIGIQSDSSENVEKKDQLHVCENLESKYESKQEEEHGDDPDESQDENQDDQDERGNYSYRGQEYEEKEEEKYVPIQPTFVTGKRRRVPRAD